MPKFSQHRIEFDDSINNAQMIITIVVNGMSVQAATIDAPLSEIIRVIKSLEN